MGYWKDRLIEMMEGGYEPVPDRWVCPRCLTDDYLCSALFTGEEDQLCSYCRKPGAIPVDDLVEAVSGVILREYADPAEELPHESAEGGYQGHVESGEEIVRYSLDPWTENDDLLDDVADAFSGSAWCRRHYFSLRPFEILRLGWDAFVEQVKHVTRYLFLQELSTDGDPLSEIIPPGRMLEELGKLMTEHVGTMTLGPGTEIFRVRVHQPGLRPTAPAEVGSPSRDQATMPNRMSPAGIPMFYGALDEATAIVETFDPSKGADRELTVAVFTPARLLRLLDLTVLPKIPSQFDENNWHLRAPLEFLRDFTSDLRRPIDRDRLAHIDYVPTQVVTEFVRHRLRFDDQIFDGIAYGSAREGGAVAVVIFADQDACGPRPNRHHWDPEVLLTLVSVKTIRP